MPTTVTIDDELYARAPEMADPDMDKADFFREVVKTFVGVQESGFCLESCSINTLRITSCGTLQLRWVFGCGRIEHELLAGAMGKVTFITPLSGIPRA